MDFTTCKERFAFSSSFLLFAPFWGGYYVYPNGGETYGSEDGTNYDVITQLSEEVSQLNAQVARLREEHDVMVYDQQERRNPATRPDASKSEPPAPTPTSLIFRDGSRMDVQNYVVLGKTLWIFGEQRAHKLPLSDLDLDLTRLVNDEEGVDFLAAH